MTKKPTAAAVLLTALAVTGAAAGCGSTKSTASHPRVLRLLGVDDSYSAIDVHGAGGNTPAAFLRKQKVGDRFLFTKVLYKPGAKPNQPSGKPIGRGAALCTVTAPRGQELACTGPLYLPGGYILMSDAFRPSDHAKVTGAVIGGVGAYANARGTVDFVALKQQPNGPGTDAIVVRLVP
jgi:hypothetical protein